ncbi:YbaB/EbfC family nucleoid-associated protein [Iodidimonas sp. SYSU 1G8]|uniref:YbaB/EbfC family nucleoid-associated protein n=1 Tax=Iodidimonas sp. SYSU 1G8 TaxID=3133967 RepID=UPI0031FE633D
MKNLAGMLKQAQQMQQKMADMQAALDSAEISGTAGGGMVNVVLSGKGELKRIKIDPSIANADDVEILEDLIVAAHKDAKGQVEAHAAEEMKKVTGGLELPPGMSLPF